jgi:hypothetical protein
MDEFTTAMQEVIPLWSTGQEALQKSLDDETIELYKQMEIEALEERLAVLKAEDDDLDDDTDDYYEEPDDDEPEEPEQKEDEKDMKINKSLLTAEEQAQLEALIQKSAVDDTLEEDTVTKAAPENEALKNEVAELKKALELKDMETVAKGYAILGKDTAELAKSLYAMKQAGPEVYAEFVGALDIAKAEREGSGMFTEVGKSRTESGSGAVSKIEAKAAEIQKADPTLSRVQAIRKAWEQNPDLVKEYDNEEGVM